MTDGGDHRYAMIMAGGAGTRLWPMSRRDRPKQLLPLIGGRSLLELAAERLEGTVQPAHRLICTGESFRAAIRERMPAFTDEQILGEPVGRDTLNAVGLTAAVLAWRDPKAVFAVLTSDHLIEPLDEFQRKLAVGFALVEAEPRRCVTFGVRPTHAATSYGYVRRGDPIDGHPGAFRARGFVEKPDEDTARACIESGEYEWNSGMFVFGARAFLAALERFQPESLAGLRRIADAWEAPERRSVLEAVYPTLPRTSVDYGIMEPASADPDFEICVVPLALSWIDVGSWTSYRETLEADDDGNRSNTRTVHIDSHNVLCASDDPNHTIATIGCRDLIIVHTADATLVCPVDRDQDVKTMAGEVEEELK